jgi:hypothetical protein
LPRWPWIRRFPTDFNPVKSKFLAYGLGWTALRTCIDSVGVVGWMKKGDFALNGAVIIVCPLEKLGFVVVGSFRELQFG